MKYPSVGKRPLGVAGVILIAAVTWSSGNAADGDPFRERVQPLLARYCFDCHSSDDPAGNVDLSAFASSTSTLAKFELWEKVSELLSNRKMPPEGEAQPTDRERDAIRNWYQATFVDSVEPRPGPFRPRRLSATEYRNTLRSLFGFDLEVAIIEAEQTITEKSLVLKLLPTDPPGKSRFRNDTHSNPLTVQIWEQYSYLTDAALAELFSEAGREQLEEMVGPVPASGFGIPQAEALVRHLVPRAFRRDIPESRLEAILETLRQADDLVSTTKSELKAVLMSPAFMYRGLLMPSTAGEQQRVDAFELAERLSYFLWSDMPDDELMGLARNGSLMNDAVLQAQVTRMLDSSKAETLASDFAVQWLAIDEIEQVSNNPPIMVALKSQPIDFFHYLVTDNRPLLELIDSKITFASPLTRKYYQADASQLGSYRKPSGIEIQIVPNQKLVLEHTLGRGGLLTMPGVLAMNRGPILRGVWMLERIMGEHLPDPPADVGQVQANAPGEQLTFRERFSQHRENASCAICHDKIDPLGFALAGYDDKGNFRLTDRPRKKNSQESTPTEIDTSGTLPTGEAFDDFEELKSILVTSQRERITRNIVKQMLAYALCRKLEIYDRPAVESIVNVMVHSNGTWRDLIHEIVRSLPFRETYVPDGKANQAVSSAVPTRRGIGAGGNTVFHHQRESRN